MFGGNDDSRFHGRSSRGRRGGGRYNSRGSSGGRFDANSHSSKSINNAMKICSFHAKNHSCNNGDGCRYSHCVSASKIIAAHEQPIATTAILQSPFRILTGSKECGIKVWNLDSFSQAEFIIPTKGAVSRIEVNSNAVLWAAQEPMIDDIADSSVGIIKFLVDSATLSTIPIIRSDLMPFTHQNEVGYFTTAVSNGVLFVITGGSDGVIRTWQYDQTKNTFLSLSLLEGHGRSITSLLIIDSKLWSASMDTTIRIWDIASGNSEQIISSSVNGHKAAVCCLKQIPSLPPHNQSYITSGGCDGLIKIWGMDGQFIYELLMGENIFVTALEVVPDIADQAILVAGLSDGKFMFISCKTMQLVNSLDSNALNTTAVNSIISLGNNQFISAGDDGQLIVWQIEKAFKDQP